VLWVKAFFKNISRIQKKYFVLKKNISTICSFTISYYNVNTLAYKEQYKKNKNGRETEKISIKHYR